MCSAPLRQEEIAPGGKGGHNVRPICLRGTRVCVLGVCGGLHLGFQFLLLVIFAAASFSDDCFGAGPEANTAVNDVVLLVFAEAVRPG